MPAIPRGVQGLQTPIPKHKTVQNMQAECQSKLTATAATPSMRSSVRPGIIKSCAMNRSRQS